MPGGRRPRRLRPSARRRPAAISSPTIWPVVTPPAIWLSAISRPKRRVWPIYGERQAALEARGRDTTGAVTEIEIGLARCDERIAEIERRRAQLAEGHGIEVVEPEQPLEVDEAAAQAARLERLERRRESLGAVNPLAQEEYEQEKQRAEDLTAQCDDLERSLWELRTLIRDLTRTIDERFAATFQAVARHFSEVIETLFPGGRGRLQLTEPEVVSATADEEGEPADAEPV